MALRNLAAAALFFGTAAFAKTDLQGCTYIDGVFTPDHGPAWATRTWYVPDSGEICELLDCGGGRAPPKTNVPGCFLYEGTETYSPDYLDLASITGDGEVVQTSTSADVETITSSASEEEEEEGDGAETEASTAATVTSSEPEETGAETSASETISSEPGSSETSSSETSTPETSTPETSHSDHTTAHTTTSPGVSSSTSDSTSTPPASEENPEGAATAPAAAILGSTLAASIAIWLAMF